MLSGGRGSACDWVSPCVDEYGEQDIALKRGRPLALCGARYGALGALWAGGGVAREVASVRAAAHRYWHLGVF